MEDYNIEVTLLRPRLLWNRGLITQVKKVAGKTLNLQFVDGQGYVILPICDIDHSRGVMLPIKETEEEIEILKKKMKEYDEERRKAKEINIR